MSGDLISKDVLLEDVRNNITECSGIMDWLKLIDRQPTAYNVDKVVEQLEDIKNNGVDCKGCPYDCPDEGCEDRAIDQAIELVKAGGVE